MNEDIDNIRCKDCGASTHLAHNEIVPSGIFKIGKDIITYHICNIPLCNAYTRVIK
jgi:hypothetical protein